MEKVQEVNSLSSLQHLFKQCHSQLDELFLLHQEALLQGELTEALFLLEIYWSCHSLHSDFEDAQIFPVYRDLPEPGRWDATLYNKEHQKIKDLYETVRSAITTLIDRGLEGSPLRRGIIQLMDREKSFKGLCEHHQEREEQSLLVELDAQADSDWKMNTAGQFSDMWEIHFSETVRLINRGAGGE